MKTLADRVRYFSESVIREMTRLANRHGAVNLAQGMPDFDTPLEIREAACRAIHDGFNQYSITWGSPPLREAIARKVERFNGIECVPDEHITVCCGSTECMMATMLATVDPGDEVILFQPYYENYRPDTLLSGAKPVWVHLRGPDWTLDEAELRAAFRSRTRAIVVNTPHNPTGKVFSRAELALIAELCVQHDVLAITDEIYEHIQYTAEPHVSLATLPGMKDRTVTISGLSKTFSITGWRLGYVIAPAEITRGIRRVHDFLTVGAAHPLQVAAAAALAMPDSYYAKIRAEYQTRRDLLVELLRAAGFTVRPPDGAYYIMVDISPWQATSDVSFVRRLIEEIGVAAVPASSFYSPPELGSQMIRFMFAKKEETLREAGRRLQNLRELVKNG